MEKAKAQVREKVPLAAGESYPFWWYPCGTEKDQKIIKNQCLLMFVG
jgi:hypothetical protein